MAKVSSIKKQIPISSSYGLSRPSQPAAFSSDDEEVILESEGNDESGEQESDVNDTQNFSEEEVLGNAEEDLKDIDFASIVGAQKALLAEQQKERSSSSSAPSRRKEHQEEIKAQLSKLKASRKSSEHAERKRSASSDESEDGDDNDDSESSESEQEQENGHTSRYKRQKRLNKHAPQEVTSKRPVTRLRQVVDVPKIVRRDPRFEPVGHRSNVDPRQLRKDYAFLDDYEHDEIKKMELDLKRVKDPQEKLKLQRAIQSKKSRLQTLADKDFADKIIRQHESKERQAVKEGKKPYYLKDSEKKKLVLSEKFKTMKKSEITKKIARRERKQTAKSRKQIPEARFR